MEPRFSALLTGFRKNHNTQYALVNILKNWKSKLGKSFRIGAIFMNLSKAFNTLNNDPLLGKLNAHGFSKFSITYIKSYLTIELKELILMTSLVHG